MSELVIALTPAFAIGFAIQRITEILDPILELVIKGISCLIDGSKKLYKRINNPSKNRNEVNEDGDKKDYQKYIKVALLGLISLIIGLFIVSIVPKIRVLDNLGIKFEERFIFIDSWVTALIISAGTEGFNSILKFMEYGKKNKENTAKIKEDILNPNIKSESKILVI